MVAEVEFDVASKIPELRPGDALVGPLTHWLPDDVEYRVFKDRDAIRRRAKDRPHRVAWPLSVIEAGTIISSEAWQTFAKVPGPPSVAWLFDSARAIRRVPTKAEIDRRCEALRPWLARFNRMKRNTRPRDCAESWCRTCIAFLISAGSSGPRLWLDRLVTSGWFSPADHHRVVTLLDTFDSLEPVLRGPLTTAPPRRSGARPGPRPGSTHGIDRATADQMCAEIAQLIDDGLPATLAYERYSHLKAPETWRSKVRSWRRRNQ